jgi:CelD/BcsL family acetyltransferase involved in cellulose biosynthesis
MAPPFELLVEQLPHLPGQIPDWQRLGVAAGNPFTTWEWASTWWRHFGEDRPQRILGCRDEDGALVGVLPLYLSARRPLRTLRFVGNGPADQLGPVCAPEHREAVAAAFRRALSESGGWDVCVAERMAAADGWSGLLGGVVTRSEPTPTIALETTDWDEYLGTRSAHFRQQVRRLERRLGRDYELEFRLAEDPGRLEQDMDTFFDLHEARWAATGSTVFSGELRQFHQELAALALAGGWLRLCFAELDGVPRAATYGFRLGNADWFYQTGRDPQFDKSRVGQVLLNHTVREAVSAGMGEFKFLLGDEGYKSRYTDDPTVVETVGLGANRTTERVLSAAVFARGRARSLSKRVSRRSAGG